MFFLSYKLFFLFDLVQIDDVNNNNRSRLTFPVLFKNQSLDVTKLFAFFDLARNNFIWPTLILNLSNT